MKRALIVSWFGLMMGCGAERAQPDEGNPEEPAASSSCAPGAMLTGAAYDVGKSKFAFGSKPVRSLQGTDVHWTGANGVVAMDASGYTLGILNAGVAEANVADWNADDTALTAHMQAYFAAMGVDACQLAAAQITSDSSGQATPILNRAVDGIAVLESFAWARIDANDLSTGEGFWWPTVSAAVVSAARAFRDQLGDPTALAAFKAKLPANAQGDGQVVIHHSSGLMSATSVAVASYDVVGTAGPLGSPPTLSFTADAQPLMLPQ